MLLAFKCRSQRAERRAGNQHFLLPVAKGSATVAVPLSLDTQAAHREEGRQGGKRKRRRKKQARQRERTKEADRAV